MKPSPPSMKLYGVYSVPSFHLLKLPSYFIVSMLTLLLIVLVGIRYRCLGIRWLLNLCSFFSVGELVGHFHSLSLSPCSLCHSGKCCVTQDSSFITRTSIQFMAVLLPLRRNGVLRCSFLLEMVSTLRNRDTGRKKH